MHGLVPCAKLIFPKIGKFIGAKIYNKLKLKNVKVGQLSVPKKPKFVDILLLPLELKEVL